MYSIHNILVFFLILKTSFLQNLYVYDTFYSDQCSQQGLRHFDMLIHAIPFQDGHDTLAQTVVSFMCSFKTNVLQKGKWLLTPSCQIELRFLNYKEKTNESHTKHNNYTKWSIIFLFNLINAFGESIKPPQALGGPFPRLYYANQHNWC